MAEAMRRAGSSDLGSGHVHEVVARWCEDLEAAPLSDEGSGSLERILVRNLTSRLEIHAMLSANPKIAGTPLPRILLITGLPRSGTTLLHQLLSCHPLSRPLLRWELVTPLPPPEAASYRTDPRIARAQASIEPMRGTILERTHWVNADEPEECPWGFYDGSGLLGRGVLALMRSWGDHVRTMNHRATFAEYRRLIQILLWRNPPEPGSVLVLKSPAAAEHLDAFLEVFPGSSFVVTHRDPVRTVVSTATVLGTVGQRFTSDGIDTLANDGRRDRLILQMQSAAVERLTDFAQRHRELVTHVGYPTLMADPVGVTVGVLAQAGFSHPEQATPTVTALLERQVAGHRISPPSDYGDRGYRADDIRGDGAIAAYCDAFDVEHEAVRITEPTQA